MNIIDILIMGLLFVCIIRAITKIKGDGCHDCMHCQKECGGKYDGKELRKFIKDQGKSID